MASTMVVSERVKSGLAAAQARGVVLRQQVGVGEYVLTMHRDGLSYRLIGRNLGLSKNNGMGIVRRDVPKF